MAVSCDSILTVVYLGKRTNISKHLPNTVLHDLRFYKDFGDILYSFIGDGFKDQLLNLPQKHTRLDFKTFTFGGGFY